MNSSSTLVATVSINYEDFTEGFLTCGTCLYAYDQADHTPKLLSCSHTICQSCLELIASSPTLNNSAEAGCIKCPICRQNIAIPNGGIGALPPSFLVNQLFDLVNKKPREFIPKCSVHIEQELLFCETCDCVFCDTCNNSNESDDSLITTTSNTTTITTFSVDNQSRQQNSKQHINEICTVIPFSTAIKRMSEILNYRSHQCSGKLDEARDNVQREIEKLESNRSDATRDIKIAFEKIKTIIEEREKGLLEGTQKLHEYKKNILLEQLKTIESEKSNLSVNNSVKINNETDVKNLSKKISDLTEKNDTALALFTPRENCFIRFESENYEALGNIQDLVNEYGKIRTSKTYPPYCTSKLIRYSTHLRSTALVQSIDYEGSCQKIGGDPIQAELRLVGYNDEIDGSIEITDKRDGTYEVAFIPPIAGKYQLFIYIFNRPIKNCPLLFETNSHHNPVAIFGQSSSKGMADQFDHFSQPASLTINKYDGRVFILDSFNNRIKVLAQIDSLECPFSFMQHIQPDFFGRSCTGIALLFPEVSLSPTKPPNPNVLVTDWRNRVIYELNTDGILLRQYTHEDLLEPTNIVVDSRGRIFVVDRESIFVFNSVGKLLNKLIGYKYTSKYEGVSSIKKVSPFSEPQKQQQQQLNYATNLIPTGQTINRDSTKEMQNNKTLTNNTATLNTYLITTNDKRSNTKTNTLSSLISVKRKPKIMNPSSSLQKGSKAVLSAASRIRSSFTLSHSTSLVSAASLQSMFNNNNKQTTISSQQQNHHHQQFDNQSVSLPDNQASNNYNNSTTTKQQKSIVKYDEQHNNNSTISSNETFTKQTLPINEQQEDGVTLINNLNMSDMSAMNNSINSTQQNKSDTIEPFGIIRGIAIGPDDELIVADESRVRVLESGVDEYVFKRELLVSTSNHRTGVHINNNSNNNASNNLPPSATYNIGGRLCGMTFDGHSRQLLILRTSFNTGIPFIQIVDYSSGKAKFNIDSYDSRLKRPSSLATYGQHVIVTDLGSDCIKKYRFY